MYICESIGTKGSYQQRNISLFFKVELLLDEYHISHTDIFDMNPEAQQIVSKGRITHDMYICYAG